MQNAIEDCCSGDTCAYRRWVNGYRPKVTGNKVSWPKSARPDSSTANFSGYLETVFNYAGSYSLERDLPRRQDPCAVQVGDLFTDGGFSGHVVIVVDVAEHEESKKMTFHSHLSCFTLLLINLGVVRCVLNCGNPTRMRLSPAGSYL